MKPITKDGLILRDEQGNWTAHSVPLSFRHTAYYAVLSALDYEMPRRFDVISNKVVGLVGSVQNENELRQCLIELEKVECVRREGVMYWCSIRAADRKMKGYPFPLDHILHQQIPRA